MSYSKDFLEYVINKDLTEFVKITSDVKVGYVSFTNREAIDLNFKIDGKNYSVYLTDFSDLTDEEPEMGEEPSSHEAQVEWEMDRNELLTEIAQQAINALTDDFDLYFNPDTEEFAVVLN